MSFLLTPPPFAPRLEPQTAGPHPQLSLPGGTTTVGARLLHPSFGDEPARLPYGALREIAAGNITPEMLREPEPRQESIVPEPDAESTFRAPQFGLVDREL